MLSSSTRPYDKSWQECDEIPCQTAGIIFCPQVSGVSCTPAEPLIHMNPRSGPQGVCDCVAMASQRVSAMG